jgi:GntR family transcriptional regulator
MFDVDLQSRTPIYEQLYKRIIEHIIKGLLKENDRLPSVRSLAQELGINPNTVAKTYQELERNKIIYSLLGRGNFVAKITDSGIKNYAGADFDSAAKEALGIGFSKSELKNRIDAIKQEITTTEMEINTSALNANSANSANSENGQGGK